MFFACDYDARVTRVTVDGATRIAGDNSKVCSPFGPIAVYGDARFSNFDTETRLLIVAGDDLVLQNVSANAEIGLQSIFLTYQQINGTLVWSSIMSHASKT